MSISVACECGRHFDTPETNAGQGARCPDCGREVPVTWPEVVPTSGRRMPRAGIVLGVIACLITPVLFLIPPVRTAREAARRSQCVCNLKQIGLALLNYHDVYGSLPPAAIADQDGKPLLSWRVAILPLLESGSIYAKFHLDEPWDSPHNLTLLTPVPQIYACPSNSTREPGMTDYQAIVGPGTAFTPDLVPLRFQDFFDGVKDTLLVGESRRCVPWTRPEDLPFDTALSLHGLGSHHNGGFNALFADGAIRFLKDSIAPAVLGAILTPARGEVVSADSF